MNAYEAGDNQEAFRLFLALAEHGDAKAQYNLGFMYDNGEGIPEDDVLGYLW